MGREVVILDDFDEDGEKLEQSPTKGDQNSANTKNNVPLVPAKQCNSTQLAVGSPIYQPSDAGLARTNATSIKKSPFQSDTRHQEGSGPGTNTSTASETPQAYHVEYKRDRTDLTISGPFAGRSLPAFDIPNPFSTNPASQDTNGPLQKGKNLMTKAEPESLATSDSLHAASSNVDHDTTDSHPGTKHQCKADNTLRLASPLSPIDLTVNNQEKASNSNHRENQISGTELAICGEDHGRIEPCQPQSISGNHCTPWSSQNVPTLQRNLPIAFPIKKVDSFTFNDIKFNSKANVELNDGDFMRIVDILQDTTTLKVSLRGWIFRRTRQMNGLLERKVNELCWIMHIDEDDPRDPTIQAMVTVPVDSVKGRRKIRMTNKPFPAYSFREDDCQDDERTIIQERVLVCRFKYVCLYVNAQSRERYIWCEKAVHRLRARECEPSLAEDDDVLRYEWRGDTEKGGADISFPTETRQQYGGVPSLISDMNKMRTPSQGGSEDVVEILPPSPAPCRKRKRQSSYTTARTKSSSSKTLQSGVESTTNVATSDLALSDTLHQSILNLLSHHETRSSSPEIMEIDLRIKNTTNAGTLERRYESRITSTFTLHGSQTEQNANESVLRNSGRPLRRLRNDQSHTTETSVTRRADENPSRSISPAARESTLRESLSPPLVEDLEQRASRTSNPHTNLLREPQSSIDHGSCNATTPAPTLVHDGSSASQSSSPNSLTTSKCQRRVKLQRYTFGDCFCGGGGMARGASKAGLDVRWGFDFNQHACETYAMNFPEAEVHNKWAHEIPSLTECFKVDICHLSPPCQFFSPAHTVMGKDDEMNTASLFAIAELLKKAKPRVVTLEQTSGLISGHELYFNAVVQIFVTLGFSIRWRLMNCADFGLPQRRLRVFMIAS
ncbi:MAG: hypothetical protein Q9191_007032, partial [Dirinaria sp. TL-2023a]